MRNRKKKVMKEDSEFKVISSPQRGTRFTNLGNKGKSSGKTFAKVRKRRSSPTKTSTEKEK